MVNPIREVTTLKGDDANAAVGLVSEVLKDTMMMFSLAYGQSPESFVVTATQIFLGELHGLDKQSARDFAVSMLDFLDAGELTPETEKKRHDAVMRLFAASDLKNAEEGGSA